MLSRFFLIFLGTILITRLLVFWFLVASPTVGSFRMHHYMYGIVLMVIGGFTKSTPIFAIGLGLFVDELTYILIGGKTHADNYSNTSLLGTLFFIIVVFFSQKYLKLPLE